MGLSARLVEATEMPQTAHWSLNLPKLAQELLTEFGRTVKLARSSKGWELNDVANRIAMMESGRDGMLVRAPARTFLSDIEKGKRSISLPTVGKLIHALNMPESWLHRFLNADYDQADEETGNDRGAERLLRLFEKDATAPATAEPLLLLLAEEWAQKSFTDPTIAYNALRGALQAAAELKAQSNLPSNASDQLQAILRRVSDLNDQGLRDEAGEALAEAIQRNQAEAGALFEASLKQDRLQNRPDLAAKRLVANLHAAAPAGGVFRATVDTLVEWRERGDQMGDPFDLAVALELARMNHARAKGPQRGPALQSLGNCHLSIGITRSGDDHLVRAVKVLTAALKEVPRRTQPGNWALIQSSLGNALGNLGHREGNTERLEQSLLADREALKECTRDRDPIGWAMTQNNLGTALQALGELEGNIECLEQAVLAFDEALKERTQNRVPVEWAATQNNLGVARRWLGTLAADVGQFQAARAAYSDCLLESARDNAPFPWAKTQWNLGDLALAWHAVAPDPALLVTAKGHLEQAREVFAIGENEHQIGECDRLLAQIETLRGGDEG